MLNVMMRLNPIRYVIGQKTPITLNVILRNNSDETELASVAVKTPTFLGFDKSSLTKEKRARVDYIKPQQEKIIPFPIYARHDIKEGVYSVSITVKTHPERYDRVKEEKQLNTNIRVIS